jgi:hypothetical protein
MKLDLEDKNVEIIEASVLAVRSYFDGLDLEEAFEGIESALDNAQGTVFDGEADCAYVIIKVTK